MSLNPYTVATEGVRAGHKLLSKLGLDAFITEILLRLDPRFVIRKLSSKVLTTLMVKRSVSIDSRTFEISKLE